MPDLTPPSSESAGARDAQAPGRLCPWWLGYLLACPLRRLFDSPAKLLAPHVRPGMTVLEPGPGMGFYTLELARLAGASGRVIAVDVQPRMLRTLERRATKAGLRERLTTRLATGNALGLDDLAGMVDFTLACAVVHEVPSAAAFFRDVARASKPGARLLFVEPAGHVTAQHFEAEVQAARDAGFRLVESHLPCRGHSALLERTGA